MKAQTLAKNIGKKCTASHVRSISRIVTRIYDDALRPHGLRVTQLNILAAVAREPNRSPGELAEELSIDKSTLSRSLDRMLRNKWIAAEASEDERSYGVTLAPAGAKLLEKAGPAWQAAQRKISKLIGAGSVSSLQKVADGLPPLE